MRGKRSKNTAPTSRRETLESKRTAQLRRIAGKLSITANVQRQELIDLILKHEARTGEWW